MTPENLLSHLSDLTGLHLSVSGKTLTATDTLRCLTCYGCRPGVMTLMRGQSQAPLAGVQGPGLGVAQGVWESPPASQKVFIQSLQAGFLKSSRGTPGTARAVSESSHQLSSGLATMILLCMLVSRSPVLPWRFGASLQMFPCA